MVFGGSRGIGAKICESLYQNGYKVIVLAKTSSTDLLVGSRNPLPGTIEQVAQNCNGTSIKCNVAVDKDIESAVNLVIQKYGRIDCVIYNAGSILWEPVIKTPLKRYELMHNVNAKGLYSVIQYVLPIFTKQNFGRFIVVSPPIYSRFFKGKTPYAMTKIAMTVLAIGLATELSPTMAITCLWPATGIKSYVTDVKGIKPQLLRKPDIFADAVVEILQSAPSTVNGKCLLDEDFLRSRGYKDFERYRCDPQVEPPRMMPMAFPDLRVKEEAKL